MDTWNICFLSKVLMQAKFSKHGANEKALKRQTLVFHTENHSSSEVHVQEFSAFMS